MNVAAIQIMRRQLGLSEARYRDLLRRIGGVSSSKDLTQPAARKVYGALRRMAVAATPAARYVWVLWNQLQPYLPPADRHGAYLVGIIRKCVPACAIADLSELSLLKPGELHQVIEALKKRIAYEQSKMADVPF